MKKRDVLLWLILATLASGCGPTPVRQGEALDSAAQAAETEKEPAASVQASSEPQGEAADQEEGLTPQQFLTLICANAEVLSFSYGPDGGDGKKTLYQRRGETSVEVYTAEDMNGNAVSVRELESGGAVHYIMDDSGVIKTYQAPAEDFMINRMLTALAGEFAGMTTEDQYRVYDYRLPFEQDESLRYLYRFHMASDTLAKLTIALGEEAGTTYVFSPFSQEITEEGAFIYPQGYMEESFSYSYSGDLMPPWWEIGNDG